jgi:hypothetical protein
MNEFHKALALVFRKLGIVEMLITDQDIEPLNAMKPEDMPTVVLVSQDDGLHVVLATAAEAKDFDNRLKEALPSIILPDSEIITQH